MPHHSTPDFCCWPTHCSWLYVSHVTIWLLKLLLCCNVPTCLQYGSICMIQRETSSGMGWRTAVSRGPADSNRKMVLCRKVYTNKNNLTTKEHRLSLRKLLFYINWDRGPHVWSQDFVMEVDMGIKLRKFSVYKNIQIYVHTYFCATFLYTFKQSWDSVHMTFPNTPSFTYATISWVCDFLLCTIKIGAFKEEN